MKSIRHLADQSELTPVDLPDDEGDHLFPMDSPEEDCTSHDREEGLDPKDFSPHRWWPGDGFKTEQQ